MTVAGIVVPTNTTDQTEINEVPSNNGTTCGCFCALGRWLWVNGEIPGFASTEKFSMWPFTAEIPRRFTAYLKKTMRIRVLKLLKIVYKTSSKEFTSSDPWNDEALALRQFKRHAWYNPLPYPSLFKGWWIQLRTSYRKLGQVSFILSLHVKPVRDHLMEIPHRPVFWHS